MNRAVQPRTLQPRAEILRTPRAEHGGLHSVLSGTSSVIDFSVCLNAYGPANDVRDAIRNTRFDEYPDRFATKARDAASQRWNRPIAEMLFGAGAVELIYATCFAYLERGDAVVVAEPCFSEYARAASLCGASVHAVRTALTRGKLAQNERKATQNEDEHWNTISSIIGAVQRTDATLAFLASPTSPAGGRIPLALLRLLADACAQCDCLLVLDQSYDAFLEDSLGTPALPGHANVVHIRSLTKDHALAGVRVAFALAPPDVAQYIERARMPWVASALAQAAAIAAFSDSSLQHVARTTRQLRLDARTIAAHCALRGIPTVPSSTHYLLVECGDAPRTRQRLLDEHHILVRDCTSFGLPSHVRVASRTPAENRQLLHAIDSLAAPDPRVPPARHPL